MAMEQNNTFLDSADVEDEPSVMLAGKPDIGWKNATKTWGSYWMGLRYGAITIDTALFIWTTVNMIYILTKGRTLISRKYFFSLNLMVWIFSLSKLLFYWIDPKSIKGIMPPLVGSLLVNSNFPTLSVGFFMLYIALRQCTVPNRHLLPLILKTKCIAVFIITCFVVSYSTDILVAHFSTLQIMILVCQLFYILWGFVFSALYTALAVQYSNAAKKVRKKMEKTCYRRGHCRRGFNKRNLKKVPICVKVACVTAILFFLFAILNIFLVLVEIGFLNKSSSISNMCNRYRKPWNFFLFHAIFTAVEHLMAITLAMAGTQPLKWLRLSPVTLTTGRTMQAFPSNISSLPNLFTVDTQTDTSFTDVTATTQSQQSLATIETVAQIDQPNIPQP